MGALDRDYWREPNPPKRPTPPTPIPPKKPIKKNTNFDILVKEYNKSVSPFKRYYKMNNIILYFIMFVIMLIIIYASFIY